jgi:comEA protein
MWGIGSILWLVVIIQIVSAKSETVIVESDLNKAALTLLQESSAPESTSHNPPNPEDSVLPADTKKPVSNQQNDDNKKDVVKNKETCINVNTASVDELVSLQGIGPVLAQRIVDFRKDNGDFKDESDLIKVKGIGEGKLKKMRDHICF